MALERNLARWVDAGLIDPATADGIRAFEAGRERPTALWAIAGLGLFALGLGIILLVSANWDRIPDGLKLGLHMALLAGAAATHWIARRDARRWLAEGSLFLFSLLTLAGIALQAQVYQLAGPLWHALLLWLALAGPALLLGGATRLTGLQFSAMALFGPLAMAVDTIDRGGPWLLAQGAAMAVPLLLLLLALDRWRLQPAFRAALREAGIVLTLAGASIAHFAWASNITSVQALDNAARLLPLLAVALAGLLLARGGGIPRSLILPLFLGPPLALGLALAIPHPDHMASRLLGIIVYTLMWAAVARGASASGWSTLFATAVAAIALRIFIIYVELFGSLAATGGGLVTGGLLLIALAWGWRRIVREERVSP